MKKMILLCSALIIMISCNEYDETNQPENAKFASKLSIQNNDYMPIKLNDSIILGVNGHPYTQSPYNGATWDYTLGKTIAEQRELINELGCDYYRFEVSQNTNVSITNLNDDFISHGIKVLPVIILDTDFEKTLEDNASVADAVGDAMVTKLGALPYYEVGNEMSIRCLLQDSLGNIITDGDNTNEYDSLKIDIVAEMMKRVITKLKGKSPNCKIVISNGGYLQTAFYELLIEKGVKFDIIAPHWYSNYGLMSNLKPGGQNVLGILESFNKDIWLTEFGHRETMNSYGATPQNIKSSNVVNIINDFHKNHPRVKGLFFYQLFTQPFLMVKKKIKTLVDNDTVEVEVIDTQGTNDERNHGLYNTLAFTNQDYLSCFNYTGFNQQADALKYKIEEIKFGYHDYIFSLYERLIGRQPYTDTNGVINETGYYSHVTTLKEQSNKTLTLSYFMTSPEYYRKFVIEQYATILPRTDGVVRTESDINYWVGEMQNNGLTREGLIYTFCNSPEFWTASGAPPVPIQYNRTIDMTNFIKRLYSIVLGRTFDQNGLDSWLQNIGTVKPHNLQTKKDSLINGFIHSEEYYRKFVDRQYSDLQGRPSEVDGKTYWVGQMNSGLSQADLIKNFVRGEEFFISSIINGYKRRHPGKSFVNEFALRSLYNSPTGTYEFPNLP